MREILFLMHSILVLSIFIGQDLCILRLAPAPASPSRARQKNATNDLFEQLGQIPAGGSLSVHVSFFEIYGGRCQDLLNHR